MNEQLKKKKKKKKKKIINSRLGTVLAHFLFKQEILYTFRILAQFWIRIVNLLHIAVQIMGKK